MAIYVREIAPDQFERLVGNPTLTSLDDSERAPLLAVKAAGKQAAFGVYEAEPFSAPPGKRITGPESFERDGETVRQVYAVEDIPPPPPATVRKSTVQARLIEAGKMQDAYAMLTGNATYFARWFAPDRPVVNCDDPDAILVVQALDLDPETILAPE